MRNRGIGRQEALDQANERQSYDGDPQRNTATYTQTQVDEVALKALSLFARKNGVNRSDYPSIVAMEAYCLEELAVLFGIDKGEGFIGTSTDGSSEACYIAFLSLLFRWKEKQKSAAAWRTPNLIIGTTHHVCWDKFASYHGVQLREIPITLENPVLDPVRAVELIDKDTIGIVAVLGGTHLGRYDNIEALNRVLEEFNAKSYFPVYIHVDAASGGLYTPFINPAYTWDFRLKYVASINVSGHKYGLVPAAIGWLIWREKSFLPSALSGFTVPYLGGQITTLGINFSKPSTYIAIQYIEFVGRGREGYTEVHNKTKNLSIKLFEKLSEIPELRMINPPYDLPVVCWSSRSPTGTNLYTLADLMKEIGGWHIPTYPLPRNLEHVTIQRFVCRADLTEELVDQFIINFQQALSELPRIRTVS